MSVEVTIKKNKVEIFLVVATASLYLLNNLVFKKISSGVVHYFLVAYFNDLICPIGFLAYVNTMLAFINQKLEKFYQILLFCFACGVVWEFIAPLLKASSVTDPYDLLCYCIGGVLYHSVLYECKICL